MELILVGLSAIITLFPGWGGGVGLTMRDVTRILDGIEGEQAKARGGGSWASRVGVGSVSPHSGRSYGRGVPG